MAMDWLDGCCRPIASHAFWPREAPNPPEIRWLPDTRDSGDRSAERIAPRIPPPACAAKFAAKTKARAPRIARSCLRKGLAIPLLRASSPPDKIKQDRRQR